MKITDIFSEILEEELINSETQKELISPEDFSPEEADRLLARVISDRKAETRRKKMRIWRILSAAAAFVFVVPVCILAVRAGTVQPQITNPEPDDSDTEVIITTDADANPTLKHEGVIGSAGEDTDKFEVYSKDSRGLVAIGGGNHPVFGGSSGEYEVESFALSDNFKMLEAKKLNYYEAVSAVSYNTDFQRYNSFFNNYFGNNQPADGEGRLTYNVFTCGLSESLREYILKNPVISLSKEKSSAFNYVKGFIKEFSLFSGKRYQYEECFMRECYTYYIYPDSSKPDGYGYTMYAVPGNVFCYSDANTPSELEFADNLFGKIIWRDDVSMLDSEMYAVMENGERTLKFYDNRNGDSGYFIDDPLLTSECYVQVLPGNHINKVGFVYESYVFRKSGQITMFTEEQLLNYDGFNSGEDDSISYPHIHSDVQGDTAVFDGISDVFYYVGYRDVYAVLDFHLASNPDKTYKVGVNIRSVRENDLSRAFILNETPSDVN